MSFAGEVKEELAKLEVPECCRKAELYAIIRYKAALKLSQREIGIELVTTSNATARLIVSLFKKIYRVGLEIIAVKKAKPDRRTEYVLNLRERGFEILKDLKLINDDYRFNKHINYGILEKDCCRRAVVRALFIVQGSVNDPETGNYHLEMVVENEEDIVFVIDILRRVRIFPKVIERKKGFVIYLKKSEQIGDFLNYVGAVNNLFVFEDKRIKKDFNNNVNRIINCDIANEQKALRAAGKQLENIELLREKHGLVNITSRLAEAVVLRSKYPEYTLAELSEVSYDEIGKHVGKSGLSHRFRDIAVICDNLKTESRKQTKGEKKE